MSEPRTPKYDVIRDSILRKIHENEWVPGDRIPSIAEIMRSFQVSKVTAVRALAELESEGYVRREQGRGTFVSSERSDMLESQQRRSVAVIVPDMANAFHAEIVDSLARPLRDQGIAIELFCTDYDGNAEEDLFQRALRMKHVIGVMMLPSLLSKQLVQAAAPQIPIVIVDHCPAGLLDVSVFIHGDNFQGGYTAAAHLAALGHKNIGYLTRVYGGADRLAGFRKGLADNGIALDDSRVFVTDPACPLGPEVVDFVRGENLTALFALNDMLAMQAMQALRLEGYRIPEDISLIGYDDVTASRYLEVPLTTVEQHEEQIGRKAAECILESIEGSSGPLRAREIVIVPHLVERASTGPVART